jgi:hypothetical protein
LIKLKTSGLPVRHGADAGLHVFHDGSEQMPVFFVADNGSVAGEENFVETY